MVEMKNDCNSCVHTSICKYTEQFQKSMGDIVKIANDHFAVYDFNDLVDLNIRCRQYVMAPYQEAKTNLRTNVSFVETYNPLWHGSDKETTK